MVIKNRPGRPACLGKETNEERPADKKRQSNAGRPSAEQESLRGNLRGSRTPGVTQVSGEESLPAPPRQTGCAQEDLRLLQRSGLSDARAGH